MEIKFPNTKEGIKKFLETKKKIMLDKQAELCYNVGTTNSKGDKNMAQTTKVLNDEIKARFLEGVSEHLTNAGEEVLRTGSNEIALPVLDEDGNEKWLVLTFKVPTGSREGDAYDGYSMAEDYQMKCAEKVAKAEAKKAKAEKDKAKREAKSKEKAEG